MAGESLLLLSFVFLYSLEFVLISSSYYNVARVYNNAPSVNRELSRMRHRHWVCHNCNYQLTKHMRHARSSYNNSDLQEHRHMSLTCIADLYNDTVTEFYYNCKTNIISHYSFQ